MIMLEAGAENRKKYKSRELSYRPNTVEWKNDFTASILRSPASPSVA
jgi:hypothetical protein